MSEPAAPRRGDVVSARLGSAEGSEQAGTRPVVVVSNDGFNEVMPVVTVLPITTRRRGRRVYPSEVVLDAGAGGLRNESLVLAHQVRTMAKGRLGRSIGRLDPEEVAGIDAALRLHLDLEE